MNTVSDSTPASSETLDDALNAIRVAVSLGMQVEAVKGIIVYEAIVHSIGRESDWNVHLGVFSARETAQNKVAEDILEHWWNDDYMPWEDRVMGDRESDDTETFDLLFEGWVVGKTTAEILDTCATGCSSVGYTIRPIIMQ